MARVKRGVHAKKNHKAVLEDAKGFYGNRSRVFRAANEAVMHSKQYAFRDVVHAKVTSVVFGFSASTLPAA